MQPVKAPDFPGLFTEEIDTSNQTLHGVQFQTPQASGQSKLQSEQPEQSA